MSINLPVFVISSLVNSTDGVFKETVTLRKQFPISYPIIRNGECCLFTTKVEEIQRQKIGHNYRVHTT